MTFVESFGDAELDRPYYAISFRPLLDQDGERIGAYQFVTDVTERLRAEAQLVEAQEALRQSQKLEAMGQLTGGVAHDFNNLLTPIIGSLDMLVRRELGNERERRLIDGALQSAERAKTLVQRLLAFARRQPLQPTSVDVKRLVGGMAELIASTSGPKIDVRVQLNDDLPPAVADANQLEMAILNLAVNARDAMPNGGVLTISAARESVRSGHKSKLRQGHYVCLSVKDTGTGMDQATLARAIEPFFSTKGIGKGTGSASRWCTVSRPSWRGLSRSPAAPARAPKWTFGCRSAWWGSKMKGRPPAPRRGRPALARLARRRRGSGPYEHGGYADGPWLQGGGGDLGRGRPETGCRRPGARCARHRSPDARHDGGGARAKPPARTP
jgi:hypothetical protein